METEYLLEIDELGIFLLPLKRKWEREREREVVGVWAIMQHGSPFIYKAINITVLSAAWLGYYLCALHGTFQATAFMFRMIESFCTWNTRDSFWLLLQAYPSSCGFFSLVLRPFATLCRLFWSCCVFDSISFITDRNAPIYCTASL